MLLIEFRELSSSIILINSPKLNEENFTWAPRTFLSIEDTVGLIIGLGKDREYAAVGDNEGLHATYPGSFLLPSGDGMNSTGARVFVEPPNGVWWYYPQAHLLGAPEVNIVLELQKITTPAVVYWRHMVVTLSVEKDTGEVLYARYAFVIKRVPWKDSFGAAEKPSFVAKDTPRDQKWCIQ